MAPLIKNPEPKSWGGDKGEPMGSLYTCVKTPKGIEEVERRVHGLALKSRQVLIMIDGKRDLAALQDIFPPAMLPPILDELLAGGFIRELERPKPVEPPPAPVKAGPPVPVAANDEERYALARNFMLNTVSAFVGMAGSSLTNKIEQTMDLEALAPLQDEWRAAIALSGDGKKRLPELDSQLQNLLGPPAAARPATVAAAADSARRPIDDEDRLEMARFFMLNTLDTFVGMAGSALMAKVEKAPSITELRHLYYDWRESVQLDKEGRQRLPDLEKRLAALLS